MCNMINSYFLLCISILFSLSTSEYSINKLIKLDIAKSVINHIIVPSICLLSENVIAKNDETFKRPNERIYDTHKMSYLPSHPELYIKRLLINKRVIIIGEVHSNSLYHLLQFRLLTNLAGFYGTKHLALGMECFYRQHQQALDNYIYDHGNMAILKKETNWKETWGYDLSQYAKIFNYAYKNKIRLIGLNLPIQIVQYVAENGYESLPQNLIRILPEVDFSNKVHKQKFIAAITGIPEGDDSDALNENTSEKSANNIINSRNKNHGSINSLKLQHLYESQTLWDEYMSESASNYLSTNPENKLFVIAGLGHVIRSGIPERIYKRNGEVSFVVVPYSVAWNRDGLPQVVRPPLSTDCDWAWYVDNSEDLDKFA